MAAYDVVPLCAGRTRAAARARRPQRIALAHQFASGTARRQSLCPADSPFGERAAAPTSRRSRCRWASRSTIRPASRRANHRRERPSLEPLSGDGGHAGLSRRRAALADRGAIACRPACSTADRHVAAPAGTKEGLFLDRGRWPCRATKAGERPAALMPNPYYLVYSGGAHLAGAETSVARRHRGDRLSARSRRHSRSAAGAHRAVLSLQPGQPAGRVRRSRLSAEAIALARAL